MTGPTLASRGVETAAYARRHGEQKGIYKLRSHAGGSHPSRALRAGYRGQSARRAGDAWGGCAQAVFHAAHHPSSPPGGEACESRERRHEGALGLSDLGLGISR